MRRSALAWIVLVALAIASAVLFACSQTPTSVAIRTFERAQKVDVICLQVRNVAAPLPQPQAACAPVPAGVDGLAYTNQLFALVTQTSRGEVAVVDLSAGRVVDQSHAVPGLNFLPVGAIPTDVAATPDGRMAFVASAEPNKFAIYGIPGHRILGDDATQLFGIRDPEGAVTLGSWPVCSLPQRPGALSVVPRRNVIANDGGASTYDYELVAVLPGDRTTPAKVVTIDPRPFLRGAPRRGPDGAPLETFGDGPALAPGVIAPCPITAAIELSGTDAIPASVNRGPFWQDGIPYLDGGVDLTCALPQRPQGCGARPCQCAVSVDVADSGVPGDAGDGGVADDAGACEADAGATDNSPLDLTLGPLDQPQPVAIARDDQMLYIADDAVPMIHLVDLSAVGAPRELDPFIVSSIVDPSRAVAVRDIAVSPATRDFKRFLYAVDRKEGSIAIFDVSDPVTAERTPMRRPHPELNPFQPPDRIAFSAPVVSVAFARHDFPLSQIKGVPVANAKGGVQCNPNGLIDPLLAANPSDPQALGFYYRAGSTDIQADGHPDLVPGRLRGVFAFATLSNGSVVALDVDDWDAPCRRPQNLTGPTANGVGVDIGSLAIAQPTPTAGDFDPYHAPIAPPDSVTQEIFFPVSAPHRLRSTFLLRDDSVTGKHIPFMPSTPSIQSPGVPLPLFGEGSEATPRLRPTAVQPGDSSGTENPGIRFSLDTPEVHFDQDWTVTYEGALPGFEGLPVTIATNDNYASLTLSQPQARYCARGVEDWQVGGERATAINNALALAGRAPYPERLDRRMADYVQITDDLLPPGDAYWSAPDLPGADACWDGSPSLQSNAANSAENRFNVCADVFGAPVDQNPNRDFPILEAYDDHLVVGRFATIGAPTRPREIIYKDPSNAASLKLMRCCFHNQAKYNIRTASQWSAVGSVVGFLNHLTRGDDGRCVQSCDPRESLLNGRAPSLPYGAGDFAPFRDSPLAMRNPAFAFFVQNGSNIDSNANRTDVLPTRDTSWHFQTRGEFTPLLINLAATTTGVNPQSMRFIETLGQIAVVDGALQGLVLIDLATVSIAHAPYF